MAPHTIGARGRRVRPQNRCIWARRRGPAGSVARRPDPGPRPLARAFSSRLIARGAAHATLNIRVPPKRRCEGAAGVCARARGLARSVSAAQRVSSSHGNLRPCAYRGARLRLTSGIMHHLRGIALRRHVLPWKVLANATCKRVSLLRLLRQLPSKPMHPNVGIRVSSGRIRASLSLPFSLLL